MPPLPEVRQCQDPDHFLFGSTAVHNMNEARWGVMHPEHGGHWSTDADVADWTVIQLPGA